MKTKLALSIALILSASAAFAAEQSISRTVQLDLGSNSGTITSIYGSGSNTSTLTSTVSTSDGTRSLNNLDLSNVGFAATASRCELKVTSQHVDGNGRFQFVNTAGQVDSPTPISATLSGKLYSSTGDKSTLSVTSGDISPMTNNTSNYSNTITGITNNWQASIGNSGGGCQLELEYLTLTDFLPASIPTTYTGSRTAQIDFTLRAI